MPTHTRMLACACAGCKDAVRLIPPFRAGFSPAEKWLQGKGDDLCKTESSFFVKSSFEVVVPPNTPEFPSYFAGCHYPWNSQRSSRTVACVWVSSKCPYALSINKHNKKNSSRGRVLSTYFVPGANLLQSWCKRMKK